MKDIFCPTCGSPAIDEQHDEVDVGVGVLSGPSSYLCAKGHVWSPGLDAKEEADKLFKEPL